MPSKPPEGLVVEQSGALGRPISQFVNPALLYVASLMVGQSQQTAVDGLRRLVKVLRWENWKTAPWWKLTATETTYIHSMVVRSYGPATARLTINILKGTLKQAWRVGLMSAEVYQRAILLPIIKAQAAPAGRMLSEEEVIQLAAHIGKLKSPRGPMAEAVFAAGLGGGLRREELAVLKVTALANDDVHLLVQGKGHKERIQALPAWAGQALRRWIDLRATLNVTTPFLFVQVSPTCQVRNRGLTKLGVWRLVNSLMKSAQTEHFTPHDLRRTFASRMIDLTDLVSVQKLMGHSDMSTTARYDRRGTHVAEKAVAGLEAWGFSTGSEEAVKKTITIPPTAPKGLATIGEALRAKPSLRPLEVSPGAPSSGTRQQKEGAPEEKPAIEGGSPAKRTSGGSVSKSVEPPIEKSNVIQLHPTTGQSLVSRRVVAKPDYLRNGKPLDLTWVRRQCCALDARGILPMKIVEVLSKAGVRRADGSTVWVDDVTRWST